MVHFGGEGEGGLWSDNFIVNNSLEALHKLRPDQIELPQVLTCDDLQHLCSPVQTNCKSRELFYFYDEISAHHHRRSAATRSDYLNCNYLKRI